MLPAIKYKDLIKNLSDAFICCRNPDSPCRIRMVGLVFAPPQSPLAKDQIIPQLNDWHYRSGKNIDFLFAGYAGPHPPLEGYISIQGPEQSNWLYSSKHFNLFRREIVRRTDWEYSGEPELLLLNASYSEEQGANLDFSRVILCRLGEMLRDGAIDSVGQFFEKIFNYAESQSGLDPTWGFRNKMDTNGLMSAVLSLLKKVPAGSNLLALRHFIVRDISSRDRRRN